MKSISQNIIEHAKRLYPKALSYKGYLTDAQFCEIEKECDIDFYKLVGQNLRYTIRYKAESEPQERSERMTLIDGDRIVTAQLYDDEHEEFTEEKMSIIDYVNAYTTEGVTTADDVLNMIRAEIEGNMESIIGKYDSSIPKFNMPSYKIERNKAREECISIIDKHTGKEQSE